MHIWDVEFLGVRFSTTEVATGNCSDDDSRVGFCRCYKGIGSISGQGSFLIISKMRKHKTGLPGPGRSQNAETNRISSLWRFRWIINFPHTGYETNGTAHFEFNMLSGLI